MREMLVSHFSVLEIVVPRNLKDSTLETVVPLIARGGEQVAAS